jgi:general secretion pathway protein D
MQAEPAAPAAPVEPATPPATVTPPPPAPAPEAPAATTTPPPPAEPTTPPPPAPAATTPPPPAAAPTTPAEPTTPAPAAAATPAAAEGGSAAEQALNHASNYDRIRQQQRVFEAQQLVTKARQEDANGQTADALNDYTRAAELDANNQQAVAGRDELAARTGRVPTGGAGAAGRPFDVQIKERIQAIDYSFHSNIDAANRAIGTKDFATAQRSLDNARIARNTDPTIFTPEQLNQYDATLANTNASLQRAKDAQAQEDANKALDASLRAENDRAKKAQADRERTVSGLIQDARQYIDQGKYREALAVIDHIQALDPTNEYASSVRMLIEDKAVTQEQRQYREEFNRQFSQQLNKTEERLIPYEDILRYPSNWPEISEMRDQEVKEERGENTEDAALQAQLDRRLPELHFNANAFADVVEFLRDVTGANIYVDWPALERASISRDAPVTARLRDIKFSKALELIFKSVEGEEDDRKLGYSIDEGVITISTRKELNKNVVTQRYDINDLLFVAPDYTNAPNLDITGSQGGGGGGRGGGGGQQQNIFQGGQQQQNQQEQQGQREARIDEIKKYIVDNVSPTTWKDNGGDVGSISSSPLRAVLLITQTPENHRAITKVLDSLRASQALQVSIETRFLIIQRNYLEDIGVDADFTFNPLQNPADPTSGVWSSRFSPIPVIQNQVTDNSTFRDANGNVVANPAQGSRTLDWQSNVGNASVPGSIAANPGDYPNPIVVQGSYVDNFTVNFLIRAVQANVNSTNLTAPRLTLFSGQRAVLVVRTEVAYVGDLTPVVAPGAALFDPTINIATGTGVSLSVLATVSPDRKYVYLDMQPQLSRLERLVPFSISALVQPVAGPNGVTGAAQEVSGTVQLPTVDTTIVQTSCSVPDGATLLLGGQTLAGETTREQGVPVLSKIPFLKRLFTNRADSQDEQILLILVKPTILIQHEQEQKQFPLLSSKVSS